MLKPIWYSKSFKFVSCKLRTIIWDHVLWYPISCKDRLAITDNFIWSKFFKLCDFSETRIIVHYHKVILLFPVKSIATFCYGNSGNSVSMRGWGLGVLCFQHWSQLLTLSTGLTFQATTRLILHKLSTWWNECKRSSFSRLILIGMTILPPCISSLSTMLSR